MNWLILLELVSVARAILDINSFLPSVNKIRIVFYSIVNAKSFY